MKESESGSKDASRQLQELTMIRSELQSERDALASELNDLTEANRDLQSRLDAANAALQQMKQDMDNRLREAEEEFENIRYVARPHSTDHDNLQAACCFIMYNIQLQQTQSNEMK